MLMRNTETCIATDLQNLRLKTMPLQLFEQVLLFNKAQVLAEQ